MQLPLLEKNEYSIQLPSAVENNVRLWQNEFYSATNKFSVRASD